MINESHKVMLRSHGVMVGRMLIGLLFVYSGVGILTGGVANTAEYFMAVGVPAASFMAWVALILKITAGGALILGKKVEEAALALIVFTLAATWFGHMQPFQDVAVLKNLSIIGGLLYVMAYGSGNGWKL